MVGSAEGPRGLRKRERRESAFSPLSESLVQATLESKVKRFRGVVFIRRMNGPRGVDILFFFLFHIIYVSLFSMKVIPKSTNKRKLKRVFMICLSFEVTCFFHCLFTLNF